MKRHLEKEFEDFRKMVLKDASRIQVQEMRKAFFIGAMSLFEKIMGSLDPDEEPTEADMQFMSEIHEELEDFKRRVVETIYEA